VCWSILDYLINHILSSIATLSYNCATSSSDCQVIFTSGDSSGTFPIQLRDKILQSHLALLFFSKCRCMIATRSDSRRQVHQSIEPRHRFPQSRLRDSQPDSTLLLQRAFSHRARFFSFRQRIDAWSIIESRSHVNESARDQRPATNPHVTTLMTRKSERGFHVSWGVKRASRSPRDLLPSWRRAAPDITPWSRGRNHRSEIPVGLGVSLSTAVRQLRSFVSYRGRHFAARDATPPFRVRSPCRAAPRCAAGPGVRAYVRVDVCLAVPRAEPTHELPTRACVRLKTRLRGVKPERADLRRRALASVRRVRATNVLIGVSRSVPCGPRPPRTPRCNTKFAASFLAPRRDTPWNRRSLVLQTLAIHLCHLNNN